MRRRTLGGLLAATALALLGGCASLPTPDVMKAEVAGFQLPVKPAEGKALVYMVRPSSLGGLVRFNVFLNDQADASEMGWTRGSQYIHFNVPPGSHKIWSKAENWADIAVSAKAGDVLFIEQDPSMGVIMARNALKPLDDLTGRYHVKKLTVGNVIKTDK
jgi:hypothetical protein